jgi:3-dehydroquinate dehydratase-2
VLNAAGYSHTSVAIADAVAAVNSPVVEVHISNVFAREDFRHKSLIAPNCVATLSGMGLYGYQAAINFLLQRS